MQNRKDLLQAHRLMTQRAALALMQGEPDPPDRPLRRLNMGTFSSILVAVMVLAVFGIWGVIAPGGAQGLNSPGTLIIDSQSATSYIWCHGGKLCPVVNYASARLALQTSSPNQRTVSQASLSNYPRGPEIGIPGLPQPLPDASMLVGQPWSVCVQAKPNPTTLQPHTVTTLVGGRSIGGQAVGSKALVVQASGSDWVILGGQRMLIPTMSQQSVLVALSAVQQAETVPLAWLNVFPQGSDFAPPKIPGGGRQVTGPGGSTARIGQVFTTGNLAGPTPQYYVMLSHGLAKITPTQARLLEATPKAAGLRTISLSSVAGDQSPVHVLPSGGLPQQMPAIQSYTAATPLCVVYSGSANTALGAPQVTVGGKVPSGGLDIRGAGGLNHLTLPPGKAALVGVVPGAQAGAVAAGQAPRVTIYSLVTGGLRYGLASQAVAGYLGYSLGQRTLLPAEVMNLLPQGPPLDPSKARDQVIG